MTAQNVNTENFVESKNISISLNELSTSWNSLLSPSKINHEENWISEKQSQLVNLNKLSS